MNRNYKLEYIKLKSILQKALILVVVFTSAVFVQIDLFSQPGLGGDKTSVLIDLTKATPDHKLFVEQYAPKIESETVEFHIPKIVPGTYTINNFGRFISDFKAFTSEGNELAVTRLDTNRWSIDNSRELHKISFWVQDTYHSNSKPVVFEPTGLCIIKDKVFVLNNYCTSGYFQGYKDIPFELTITKPPQFYGATSLNRLSTSESTDIYSAKNYFELHDNPIMYTIPDTASVMVNNTNVMLSIYSPGKQVTASYLIDHTKELFEAQGKYLGGTLPADKYTILLYMFTGASKSGSAGALEHFTSTVMTYPETDGENFVEPFKDVISHEFFHIVTPLAMHSEEVHNFDFINPKMSKHLWLYEGSTEYYAQHSQVKHGVVPLEKFTEKMGQKIMISSAYFNDTLPFTDLSKGALDKYKNQYINVYLKGALISMCLDLELLKLSGGTYGLQNLKEDLGKRFGPENPFKDDELFDIITEMTYPSIRDFFADYVEGSKKLPYRQFLGYAGFDYLESYEKEVPAMIGATLTSTAGGRFEVTEVRKFGESLKLKKGDLILSVNGANITTSNLNKEAKLFESTVKDGEEVTVVVLRKSSGGKEEEKTLKAKTFMTKIKENYKIVQLDGPGEEQVKIRRAWLNQ